ncbi:dynamin family protein, partial [Thermodesulfobacteriota bacterium]
MTIIFELDQLQELINNFIDRVPRILEKSTITNDLSIQVDRLIELTESPFTLAVVGQMRVGKSTLINSLVGQDLAVVGVNETTATINFFKYSQDKNKHTFRVHWKDKPYQDFTLEKIDKWVGNSDLAKNTKYLEFFCDSDFLKDIYL